MALLLAFMWLPAATCCLVDAPGLLANQDYCCKEQSDSAPGPGNCDQPCGSPASASYFSQHSQIIVIAPIGLPLFDRADVLPSAQTAVRVSRDFPTTAPPELACRWQFVLRAALPSRAPSFAS